MTMNPPRYDQKIFLVAVGGRSILWWWTSQIQTPFFCVVETPIANHNHTLGVDRAAKFACLTMAAPQLAVIWLLLDRDLIWSSAIVSAVLLAQITLMPRLISDPKRHAPWYSATGVTLYVLGMLAAALGLGGYLT